MITTAPKEKTPRPGGRHALGGALLALASLLLFLSPPALAAPPLTFAELGEGAGQVNYPNGVAIDRSSGASGGDVYLADHNNFRIDKFDAEGNFLFAWGLGVADGSTRQLQTCGPAASPPTKACFRGIGNIGEEPDGGIMDSLAVDGAGDVYGVDPGFRRVTKFGPDGEFLLTFGKNVNKTPGTPTPNLCTAADLEAPGAVCGRGEVGSGPGEFFAAPRGVHVDFEGRVWVGEAGRLIQFDSAGQFVSEATLPGGAEGASFARDSGGDFYAIRGSFNESQRGQFTGFAKGDTYRLGNLPAACSASSTDPVAWVGAFEKSHLQEALESKCGSGSFSASQVGSEFALSAAGVLTEQNLGQLTCEKVTGKGACSASTVEDGQAGAVVELEASGGPIDTLTPLATTLMPGAVALALDGADNLYVGVTANPSAGTPYVFKVFNPVGEQVSQFGAGQVIGSPGGTLRERGAGAANAIAIGKGDESLFTASSQGGAESAAQKFTLPEPGPLPLNERAEDVLPTMATLAATLNPENHQTTYHFEYGTDESYGSSTPTQTLPASGFEEEEVEAAIDHLIPETAYHFRLVATNHCDNAEPTKECEVKGEDVTFTTPPAVLVKAQWASEVSAVSATFEGELDPLGVAAEWWVEYGTGTGYGKSTPEASLGSGFGAVRVSAPPVTGLAPGTTYHYRFVARDERDGVTYVVHGPDRTIATQVSGLGFDLADDRAWEMVSPPDKHGALLSGSRYGLVQAAANGEAIAYLGRGSIETGPEGNRILEPTTTLARRTGAGAWGSEDVMPPNANVSPLGVGDLGEFKLFSSDFERALLLPRSDTPLSPAASERTPYLRENTQPPAYTPLVTGKEGFANVPPGTEFGGTGVIPDVVLAGASGDLSHIILGSGLPLAEDGPLYKWTDGQLEGLSVLPPGEGGATRPGALGSSPVSIRHAISEDGSRVFLSSPKALYMRDTEADETVRLDVVQPGATGAAQDLPVFQGAAADGSVVFFTDPRQLTEDASAGGSDLYRCELPLGGPPAPCASLTDISAPPGGSGESAEVQGVVPGISEDGRAAYFVARGVLDASPNAVGDAAAPGAPNLYLWREDGGVRFIATLADADSRDWGAAGSLGTGYQSAESSPSGRYLSFMSQRSLTGYRNVDATSGEAVQEVYLYDALADRLECISCKPSGSQPRGSVYEGVSASPLFDPRSIWAGRSVAAALPQATLANVGGRSFYRPRAVLDNGRVFFNAFDSLVTSDSNGQWDVYEYEPEKVGDCGPSSGDADTSRAAGGCVSLISSGTGEGEASFLDASQSGNDVFFLTPAQLSVTDKDHELDVYDARVDGTPAKLEPISECLGEACQPAVQAPDDPTPASASFKGQGNPKPSSARKRCARGKRAVRKNGRSRCLAKKRKRHATHRSNHRGTKR